MLGESGYNLQGPSRGLKRRANSPPEFEKGRRGYEGFRAPEENGRKNFRHHRNTSSSRSADFRTGAGENPDLAPCAICLSRGRHNVRACKATKRWDGIPTQYSRNSDLWIVDNQGNVICSDWQRPKGCSSTRHRHECSGCGNRTHGAHECPLAQPRNHDPPAT